MGWNGRGAGAGAASGAATGASFGPWGAAIGGIAGGIMGGLSGGGSQAAPQPQALPQPSPFGAINTATGGMTIDPTTGAMTQYNMNFNPYTMGAYQDSQAMYNQFMGRDNSGMTSNIDYQIKQLQQQLASLSQGAATGTRSIPAEFRGLQRFIDPTTGKLIGPAEIAQGESNPAVKALYDEFMQQTGGRYGTGGWRQWASDALKNMAPQYEAFLRTQDVQQGNAQTSSRNAQDIQNQIDYLTQQRTNLSDPSRQGKNPLMGFLTNQGPTWQGGDNSNPYLSTWEGVAGDKLREQGQDPRAWIDSYTGGADAQTQFADKMNGLIGGIGTSGQQASGINAPKLNMDSAGALTQSLQARALHNFTAQSQLRDQQNAARGMGSSAVNELAHGNDALNLSQLANENQLAGLNAYNGMVGQKFGMDAQAQQMTNAAASQNNADELARRGMQLQYTGNLQSQRFGQGMQSANLAQQIKNNLFQQALSALNANNAMRSQTRDWNVQDYTLGRNENQTAYDRNLNMFNTLNAQNQQAFGNNLATNQASMQGIGTMMPAQLSQQSNQNNANLANTQQQNAWQMFNAQNQAAQNNANTQGMWGAIGSMANSWGRNYKPTGSGTNNQMAGNYGGAWGGSQSEGGEY